MSKFYFVYRRKTEVNTWNICELPENSQTYYEKSKLTEEKTQQLSVFSEKDTVSEKYCIASLLFDKFLY